MVGSFTRQRKRPYKVWMPNQQSVLVSLFTISWRIYFLNVQSYGYQGNWLEVERSYSSTVTQPQNNLIFLFSTLLWLLRGGWRNFFVYYFVKFWMTTLPCLIIGEAKFCQKIVKSCWLTPHYTSSISTKITTTTFYYRFPLPPLHFKNLRGAV